MKKSDFSVGAVACCVAVLLVSGCRQRGVSEIDRADRASRQYSSAMAELQSGRIDSAIKGFQDVVRTEPGNGNAHFQLAALLEDVKKDYLGAIVHYRLYCLIRPDSEKAVVALERMRGCEMRYASAAMTKAGLESKLSVELAALQEEHKKCGKKLAKISDELDVANRKIAAMEKDAELKSKMLEKASGIIDDSGVASAPRKNLRPTDAQLLDEEEDGSRRISTKEIRDLRAMLDEDESKAIPPKTTEKDAKPEPAAKNPFAGFGGGEGNEKKETKRPKCIVPETYTVEEGDTLMRISAKFYGTNRRWREIREANKTVISPDGRVRVGQVIKLP